MAGLELLSDQGFRVDGRRPHELRKIDCRLGVFHQADGSAYIEQGNTKVLAAVYGPHEVGVILSISWIFREDKKDWGMPTTKLIYTNYSAAAPPPPPGPLAVWNDASF